MKTLWMSNFKFLKPTIISHCQVFWFSHQSDYQIYRDHQISFPHRIAGKFSVFLPSFVHATHHSVCAAQNVGCIHHPSSLVRQGSTEAGEHRGLKKKPALEQSWNSEGSELSSQPLDQPAESEAPLLRF